MQTSSLEAWLLETTAALTADEGVRLQTLWGGYGEIRRYQLGGAAYPSVILKRISPPARPPLSPSQARSHRRKVQSYLVEATFYQNHAPLCGADCRVPRLWGTRSEENMRFLALEDLTTAGFHGVSDGLTERHMDACLAWLASFHATFLGRAPQDLWKVGTYWHLETRPDELAVLTNSALKTAAPLIDQRLRTARFLTLVHGDAKSDNFCLSAGSDEAAAVDFQYVGCGVGIKDVLYFLTSCLPDELLTLHAERHVDRYFVHLAARLAELRPEMTHEDRVAVEQEWRSLYPLAWADFYRFLLGWAPLAAEQESYGRKLTEGALRTLAAG